MKRKKGRKNFYVRTVLSLMLIFSLLLSSGAVPVLYAEETPQSPENIMEEENTQTGQQPGEEQLDKEVPTEQPPEQPNEELPPNAGTEQPEDMPPDAGTEQPEELPPDAGTEQPEDMPPDAGTEQPEELPPDAGTEQPEDMPPDTGTEQPEDVQPPDAEPDQEEYQAFSGVEDDTAEEGSQYYLLAGIAAHDIYNNDLRDTIKIREIISTDPEYNFDPTYRRIIMGKVGTKYTVTYEAYSQYTDKTYTAARTITSIPKISENSQIEYDENKKMHYIHDPEYPDERFIIYCMNNKMHWPHITPDMGNVQVPGYSDGYLTPEHFETPEDFKECMRKMSKILYAGYPYNGERLYKIVADGQQWKPTVAEFNQMLIPLVVLKKAFPELGSHDFSYEDYVTQNQEHLDILRNFVIRVNRMEETETVERLHKADIMAMPFYKAATCMTWGAEPIGAFAEMFSSSYFVTEEQAYMSTQYAVWRLLKEYKIEENNLEDSDLTQYELSGILYTYALRGGLLEYKPTIDKVHLKGDLKFTYNPKDGMWHSGILMLTEPADYHGIYYLDLPKGVTAECENLTYIYAGEEYELVSDHKPAAGESFTISAELAWLENFKQYSPVPDIEVNGKRFQRMIGAIVRQETISAQIPYTSGEMGEIEITKSLVGETDNAKEFHFEIRLPFHKLNGLYGDLEFHEGVAKFTLKNGQTVKGSYLPANAKYIVTEEASEEYEVSPTNSEGTITADAIVKVEFTNTKLPDLTLGKVVEGELGDRTKLFTFEITGEDGDGNPLIGTYKYTGSVIEGCAPCEKPADSALIFANGKAQVKLSHGQQITIKNLPVNAQVTVTEPEMEADYTVSYFINGGIAQGEAKLVMTDDSSVRAVNTKKDVPETGVDSGSRSGGTWIPIAAGLLGIFCLIALTLRRRKGLHL